MIKAVETDDRTQHKAFERDELQLMMKLRETRLEDARAEG